LIIFKMAHRRGKVGIGRHLAAKKQVEKEKIKATEIRVMTYKAAITTVQKLQDRLTAFAKDHKKEIQTDSAFRAKFLNMCAPLGVDPLQTEKKIGFWADFSLNMDQFYHALAVKVGH